MSRASKMSSAAVKSAMEREAVQDFVQLLELKFPGEDIKHFASAPVEHKLDVSGFEEEDEYGTPIMGLYHSGIFYHFLPFTLPGMSQQSDTAPESSITVAGLTRTLMPYIRGVRGIITASLVDVHMSDPDIEQGRIDGLRLGPFSGDQDADTVTAPITVNMLTDTAYPCDSYTPDRFSGMF